jgi:glycosyltransferase involved in cell wall biosynthesis
MDGITVTESISIVVIISDRFDDVKRLFQKYESAVSATTENFEFVYVLDGEYPEVKRDLQDLIASGKRIRIVQLAKWYGESTSLVVALKHSSATTIVTLPAYDQIDADEISRFLSVCHESDVTVGYRDRESDSTWNRIQGKIFGFLVDLLAGDTVRDVGCGVRAYKRSVLENVAIYGDLYRFIPLLAEKEGYRVEEVELRQSAQDRNTRIYAPGIYARRLLDLLTAFFLVKFTKKPLRFFGLIGIGTAALGAVALTFLVVERLFGVPLGDRPALLLSVLLLMVGLQLIAVGLIGELIIFTHASDLKEYSIETIVEADDDRSALEQSA